MSHKFHSSRRNVLKATGGSLLLGISSNAATAASVQRAMLVEAGFEHDLPSMEGKRVYPKFRYNTPNPYTVSDEKIVLLKPINSSEKDALISEGQALFADGLKSTPHLMNDLLGDSLSLQIGKTGDVKTSLSISSSYHFDNLELNIEGSDVVVTGPGNTVNQGEDIVRAGNTREYQLPAQNVEIEINIITSENVEPDEDHKVPDNGVGDKKIRRIEDIVVHPTMIVKNRGEMPVSDRSDELLSI